MGLLLPLALFFGISLPVLLVFYLLKVKRRPKRVSSTYLWNQAVQDARARVPFQKLRRNLLMVLQLLALALLTLALARPVMNLVTREAGSVFMIVDTSASMAMRRSGTDETRLDEAKEKVAKLIASLHNKSQGALIEYADRAAVIEPMTSDRARLRQAADSLKVRATPQDLKGALSLAASLIASAPNPRVVIFSDSAEVDEKDLERLGSAPVTIEPCGEPEPNFGWTALDLRRQSSTSETYDLFAQIASFADADRELVVELRSGDRVLEARNLKAEAGKETPLVVEGLAMTPGEILHVRIAASDKTADALALDNESWSRAPEIQKPRLLFYTPGNYFLSRALSTAGSIEIIEASPGAAVPPGTYDLAIYDRAMPGSLPPIPSLFIAATPWNGAPNEPAEAGAGAITSWDTEHPLTNSIQWPTVAVFGAQSMKLPEGTRVLLESNDTPLLILGRHQDQPAIVLAFDLFRSNFPLRAGFPIFVKGAVDWLTQLNPAAAPQFLRGGETLTVRVPVGVDEVRVISPEGQRWPLTPSPELTVSFAETYTPGLWKIEAADAALDSFPVNLLNIKESDPQVTDPLTAGAEGVIEGQGLSAELKSNREIWRWLAAAALALLAIEWILYRRGVGI